MKLAIVTLGVLAFVPMAHAQLLEEVIVGGYRARGLFASGPDKPEERLACKLSGVEVDASHFVLDGRCASASMAGDMHLDIVVLMPGRDYEAQVQFIGEDLLGFVAAYLFVGSAEGHEVAFETDAEIDGEAYRSHFTVGWDKSGITKIVETVWTKVDGQTSVLIDLDVQKR